MKTHRLRPHVAAVLMLLPGAFALQAVPAAAQQRAPAADIAALTVNANQGLLPGSTLQFTMRAVPNARGASVSLANDAISVPLQERAPGVYEGQYVVRPTDRVDPTSTMVAHLDANGRASKRAFSYPPSFQSFSVAAAPAAAPAPREEPRPVVRDERPPRISNMIPAHGDRIGGRGRVIISAQLSDEGSGIDPGSVRLRVDGRDVSDEVRATERDIHYRDQLPPGRHTVELLVRDRARNSVSQSWSFDVLERDLAER